VTRDWRYVRYEVVDEQIAVVSLNRPERRNAQNRGLLVELGEALEQAESDDTVRVVVLRGEGPVFSAGHDLGSPEAVAEREPGPDQHPTWQGNGATHAGAEWLYRQEWHYFYSNTRRWRELRKITIASVHGPVYSAGLMLMWACDLIVADTETTFADVVAARLGMAGVEYFGHPWEFGPRRAKELLLTGDSIGAHEAHRIGMVAKVFEPGRRDEDTIAFARRIAAVPSATALFIKDSVNQAQEAQGFYSALGAAFSLHELSHSHWAVVSGGRDIAQTPETGGRPWREYPPVRPARPDVP
jgi:enoyl-CoA hydratase